MIFYLFSTKNCDFLFYHRHINCCCCYFLIFCTTISALISRRSASTCKLRAATRSYLGLFVCDCCWLSRIFFVALAPGLPVPHVQRRSHASEKPRPPSNANGPRCDRRSSTKVIWILLSVFIIYFRFFLLGRGSLARIMPNWLSVWRSGLIPKLSCKVSSDL